MTDTQLGSAADEHATPRPLRKDAVRNRTALVEAGREVFAERGLDASLDDIARRAGVGVGTAYRHFANKHELARAIFTAAIDEMIALAEDSAADPDPWQGIVRFLEGAAEAQVTNRGLREVLMGVHDPADSERINDALTAPMNRMVTAAKRAGVVRADAEASDIGAVLLMLCSVADVFVEHAPQLWRRYLPMLLDGLRSDTPLPQPPADEATTRAAFATHKNHVARTQRRC